MLQKAKGVKMVLLLSQYIPKDLICLLLSNKYYEQVKFIESRKRKEETSLKLNLHKYH